MLRLLLTPSDGGTAWRHLLAAGEARAGFECVGPLGLARRLGRILGLPAQPAAAPDRLAAFERRLERHDDGRRSYSASRKNDPFGVAAFLLALRDRLRLAGWQGGALRGSARLEDLGAIEALAEPALPPGFPDVLDALVAEIERVRRLPHRLAVELSAPREGFSPLPSWARSRRPASRSRTQRRMGRSHPRGPTWAGCSAPSSRAAKAPPGRPSWRATAAS